VKRLFRNCFIIGRRFRLCHVRFGRKVVEVSTFRRQAEADEGDTLIRRDNTFGTPEEDAFRRDFTVNALFYDIATFSVIDYVGGLEDLERRTIRTIGDPGIRLREDPVRMLRAVALAARLDFSIDPDTVEAIHFLRGEIVKSSPARILEEFYKILRQGAARRTFEMLHELGFLAYILPAADEAVARGSTELLGSLARLDEVRRSGRVPVEDLDHALLLGTLLVPLGLPPRGAGARELRRGAPEDEPLDVVAEMASLGAEPEPERPAAPASLALPFARRDLDRLRLILAAQPRLREVHRSARVRQMLAGRGYLDEALRWLEIHGGEDGGELATHWRSLELTSPAPSASGASGTAEAAGGAPPAGRRPRRRRRRHRRRPTPTPSTP
jgi:poly(A) polymerase